MLTKHIKRYAAALICALMLGAFVVSHMMASSPRLIGFGSEGDAQRYHWRVRQTVNVLPDTIGDWRGSDAEIGIAAQNLRQPNVVISRRYANASSGVEADLLLIQSRDARDMVGHHPIHFFPANGFELVWSNPRKWILGDAHAAGVRYQFIGRSENQSVKRIVDHLMILPTGVISGDLDYVVEHHRDQAVRPFGAAQLLVITDVSVTAERRDALFLDLMTGHAPVIQAIRSGVN